MLFRLVRANRSDLRPIRQSVVADDDDGASFGESFRDLESVTAADADGYVDLVCGVGIVDDHYRAGLGAGFLERDCVRRHGDDSRGVARHHFDLRKGSGLERCIGREAADPDFDGSAARVNGAIDESSVRAWFDLMATKKLSWAYWNLSGNGQTGSLFKPGTCDTGKTTWTGSVFQRSGELVFAELTK